MKFILVSALIIALAMSLILHVDANAVLFSPLKQFKSGVLPQDIKCNDNLTLIIKEQNEQPSCVKPTNLTRLLSHGWITLTKFETAHHIVQHNDTLIHQQNVANSDINSTNNLGSGIINPKINSTSVSQLENKVDIDLKDQTSCQANPLSGTWLASNSTCYVTSLTLNSGNSLTVDNSVFTNIDLTIIDTLSNYGTINNNGTLTNSGILTNNAQITNSPIGIINNTHSITNNLNGNITNSGKFNNYGFVNNTGVVVNYCNFINKHDASISNSGNLINNHHQSYNICTGNFPDSGVTYPVNLFNYGTLNNSGTVTNNYQLYNYPDGTINNSGIIYTNSGGGVAMDTEGNIINSGTIIINFGADLQQFGGTLTNNQNGAIVIKGAASLEVCGTLANYGIINIPYIPTYNGIGDINTCTSSKITNFGTIDNFGIITNTGHLINNPNATINNNGDSPRWGYIYNNPGAVIIGYCGSQINGRVSGGIINNIPCTSVSFGHSNSTLG